ncbi:MAG: protein-methionine-sulfoxide reductase catalytic subunit MsrP [Trichodesmium sp. MAG_R02]|jgi:sulfoxide reductase catalytic subunit YedY|nr:protein-methionine-sulfoxide reductase catalytic subunit MsrP [Trichodesmium sp. MAG_R02]
MPLIRIKKSWEISETEITTEKAYLNRRRFMKNLIGAGISATALSTLTSCTENSTKPQILGTLTSPNIGNFTPNLNFAKVQRPITDEILATKYNNFYEFGGNKSIWENAQNLPTENWKVEVTGLVKNSRIYDIDELQKKFPLEERIYRFRCVEAWAMVIPWLGFPMKLLVADVEPTSKAKYVRFTSFYDTEITKGPGFWATGYPWPYTEGLRIDEMTNELAFFAMGMYGKSLPKQNGAPLREVIPWKYGFKGAKSIVKIEFVEHRPATFWNTLIPNEYAFEANVNPEVPHPRWSQATERIVSDGASWSWEKRPTLLYNGYEEYVTRLYS